MRANYIISKGFTHLSLSLLIPVHACSSDLQTGMIKREQYYASYRVILRLYVDTLLKT